MGLSDIRLIVNSSTSVFFPPPAQGLIGCLDFVVKFPSGKRIGITGIIPGIGPGIIKNSNNKAMSKHIS